MEKLQISFMKELPISDFNSIFDLVTGTLDNVKIENDSVQYAANKFKSHRKKLMVINSLKSPHHLTKIIQDQVRDRTEYLGCFRLYIDSCLLSPKPERRIAAKYLKLWLKHYKNRLYPQSISAQGWCVKSMMDDVKHDAKIREAIVLLDLGELLDDIVKVTNEIDIKYRARIKNINDKAFVGQELRDAAYKDFQFLIIALHLAHNQSEHESEKLLLEKLSRLIKMSLVTINTIFKSRKTKKRKQKEKTQLQEKTNLPMIIYNELKIPNNIKLPDTSIDSVVLKANKNVYANNPLNVLNDNVNNKNPNQSKTPKTSCSSSSHNNDKETRERGGDEKLLFVGRN